MPCPHCHGTKNRLCPVCKGKGKVWHKGRLALAGIAALMLTIMPGVSITILGFALVGMMLYIAYRYFPPQDGEKIEEQPKDTEETKDK